MQTLITWSHSIFPHKVAIFSFARQLFCQILNLLSDWFWDWEKNNKGEREVCPCYLNIPGSVSQISPSNSPPILPPKSYSDLFFLPCSHLSDHASCLSSPTFPFHLPVILQETPCSNHVSFSFPPGCTRIRSEDFLLLFQRDSLADGQRSSGGARGVGQSWDMFIAWVVTLMWAESKASMLSSPALFQLIQ